MLWSALGPAEVRELGLGGGLDATGGLDAADGGPLGIFACDAEEFGLASSSCAGGAGEGGRADEDADFEGGEGSQPVPGTDTPAEGLGFLWELAVPGLEAPSSGWT